MKKMNFKMMLTPVVLAVAVLAGACSTTPRPTSMLDQARSDYAVAQANPKVATYAPLEMKRAGEALQKATAASNDRDSEEKIDKLAYLAKQQIAVTQELAAQKAAEADVANAGKERDQVRLDQRTAEADNAKMQAAQSGLATQVAQAQTAAAQQDTRDAQARAAQLEAQLADLAAKKTERGMVITLGDVLFGTDMSRLNPDGMRTAQKLADVLQQNPQRTVLVEGFTDSTGAASYNQQLSERRAGAVRNALTEMGVAGNRVAVRGYGEAHPVAGNASAQDRQMNRRVEIILSDADGKVIQR